MNSLQEIREYFTADAFIQHVGISIDEVQPGFARCSMKIQPKHLNAEGVAMGGALFTLADICAGIAANFGGVPRTVSLTAEITYLNAAKGGTLTAEARTIKNGSSTCSLLTMIYDEAGVEIASVSSTSFRLTAPPAIHDSKA